MNRGTLGVPFVLTLVACTCISNEALAQHAAESLLASRTERAPLDNAVRLNVELDPAVAIGLGYMRAFPLPSRGERRKFSIHGDVTALWGFSSWDVTTGASLRLRQKPGFDAQFTTDLELKVIHDDLRTGVTYGYGAGLRTGWFQESYFLAADLSVRGNFAQTLSHSAAYKKQHAEVVDGTYLSDTLFFYPGLVLGARFAEHIVFGARFAWRVPRDLEDYSPYYLPYTVDLELGVMF